MGSGKTTFLQGLAKGLNVKGVVLSPTFVVMRRLGMSKLFKSRKHQLHNLFHIDCYRIRKPKELLNLGFRKIINNNANVVAIEWSERIKEILECGNAFTCLLSIAEISDKLSREGERFESFLRFIQKKSVVVNITIPSCAMAGELKKERRKKVATYNFPNH